MAEEFDPRRLPCCVCGGHSPDGRNWVLAAGVRCDDCALGPVRPVERGQLVLVTT